MVGRVEGFLVLRGQILLAHGQCQVWCALEDGEMFDLGSPFLDDLDTTCSRPDDGDLLPAGVDTLNWPERGVMHDALELLHAGIVRDVPFRGKACGYDEILAFGRTAICSLDCPFPRVCVKFGRRSHATECAVLA